MSDVQIPAFDPLNPPAVDQPTFSPPVADLFGQTTEPTTPTPWGSFPPPPPGAKPNKVKRNILIGLAVFFGLGVIGAASGSGDSDSTVTAASEVDTTPTTLSSSGSSSSSYGSSSSGSSTAAMVSWIDSYGDDITDIGDTMENLTTVTGSYDISGMVSGCRTLKRQATTALSHPPMPDSSVNAPYSQALRYYQRAADACISGGTTFDADDFEQSATYLGLGNDALHQATEALGEYTD